MRRLPDAALDLELDLDLRSLRISSGRFDDAPSVRSGIDAGMELAQEVELEASGSSTVRPVQIDMESVIVLGEDEVDPVDKDEEEDEEETIIPVPRRRTRKNQPRVPRSSSSSAEVVNKVARRGRGKTGSQVVVARTRGRKVVHSPEFSERTASSREVIEIEEDGEEEDLIVVLPPKSRSTTPSDTSVSAEPQDPLEAVTHTLKSLDLTIPSTSEESPLRALLDLCAQPSAYDFSQFLSDHTFGPEEKKKGENGFRKVGEASYSEVYALLLDNGSSQDGLKLKGKARGGRKNPVAAASSSSGSRVTGLVLKVIPLTEEAIPIAMKDDSEDDEEDEEVACSLVADVKREIEITRLMSEMGDGFVRCHGWVSFSSTRMSRC